MEMGPASTCVYRRTFIGSLCVALHSTVYRCSRPNRYVERSVVITPTIIPDTVPRIKERLNHSLKESRCCPTCR